MKTRILLSSFILAVLIPLLHPVSGQTVSANTKTQTSVHIDDDRYRWSHKTNGSEFNIELRGRVEVTDDDRDIKSLSDGGYLEISKTVFGSKRSVVIESQGGGKLKRSYYEGRTLASWEDGGKAWLADILPTVVRTTGISAEARVERFFRKGGATAVLNEINQLEGDGVRAQYAALLMKQPVSVSEYAGIIRSVSSKIDSDHYKAEFLRNNIGKFIQTKEASAAVFSATLQIESDHYRAGVIKEALRGDNVTQENITTALQAASEIESDHYITEVLIALLQKPNLSDAVMEKLIETTLAIESDHYKTDVLKRALNKPNLSKRSYENLIESTRHVESDHYLSEIIKDMLSKKLTPEVIASTAQILGSIESDHYRSEVLGRLLKQESLNDNLLATTLDLCKAMDSDHYKSQVLQQAVAEVKTDGQLASVLQVVHSMDSDHYKTEVMTRAANRVKAGGTPLKDTYREVARSISSETYYGRVLRALD